MIMVRRCYRNWDSSQKVIFEGISVYSDISFEALSFTSDGYIDASKSLEDTCSFDDMEKAMEDWVRIY